MRRLAVLVLCAAGFAASPLRAETSSYSISAPGGAPALFEIPLEAAHPGQVVIAATWKGARLLSFRVVPRQDRAAVLHRSGPSPQRVDMTVNAIDLQSGPARWTLEIRATVGRDPADGEVIVTVPDPPEVVAAREEAERPPPPPPPTPDPWTLAVSAPDDAAPRLKSLFERVEDLRVAVFGDDPFTIHDPCAWQADALRWLAERRDLLAAKNASPAPETLLYFRQLAHVIRAIETLRTSSNPLLAGPPPAEPARKQAWLVVRRDALRPIETELDAVASILRKRELGELSDARWLARMLACATASERSFEARGRGADRTSADTDPSDAQWQRVVAAAAAFDALAAWLEPSP